MRYGADVVDPRNFVASTGDEPTRVDTVYSPAEQDALMSALLEHWRRNGRDVVLLERQPEPEDDA